jgi:hypothetical protein
MTVVRAVSRYVLCQATAKRQRSQTAVNPRRQSSAGDDCRGHRIEFLPTVKAAMCVNDVCQQVIHVMLS